MVNKIFLDASIAISLILKEEIYEDVVNILLDFDEIYISSLTYLFVYEKARRSGDLHIDNIHDYLDNWEILNVGSNEINNARKICKDSDFEDALQISTAVNNNIGTFITNDFKQAKRYEHLIRTITP